MIDQAIGILRGRTGESADHAFERLRLISQHEHRKLSDVALQVVQEATGRARARRPARDEDGDGPRSGAGAAEGE